MNAILGGQDCTPLLKSAQLDGDQLDRLITRTAGALVGKVLSHDAALKALKSLDDPTSSTLTGWLKDAIINQDCPCEVFLSVLDIYEFDEQELLNLLPAVYRRRCDDDDSDDDSDDEMSVDNEKDKIIKSLVAKGLNIHDDNDLSVWGTPLIQAVKSERKSAVKAVLRAGARVDQPDHDVLIHAIKLHDDGRILRVLLKHLVNLNENREDKIDINIESELWGTALHYAALYAVRHADCECLILLRSAGARERPARGLFLTKKLTPTQYIKRKADGETCEVALSYALSALAGDDDRDDW